MSLTSRFLDTTTFSSACPEPAVLTIAHHGSPPGGEAVRKFHMNNSFPLFVGDDLGVEITGVGEVLADDGGEQSFALTGV